MWLFFSYSSDFSIKVDKSSFIPLFLKQQLWLCFYNIYEVHAGQTF